MISSRTVLSCAVVGSLVFQSGCALLYELQPYRMQRINRGPPPSLDPEFTQTSPKRPDRALLLPESELDTATLSVNSTEIATVRAQSPAGDVR